MLWACREDAFSVSASGIRLVGNVYGRNNLTILYYGDHTLSGFWGVILVQETQVDNRR